MSWEYETGGDLSSGGKFLKEPGTYHLLVSSVDEPPVLSKGNNPQPIDNVAFKVNLSVCDGTVEGQKDKTTDILFFAPKLGGKDDGAFARKKIDRFLVATGMLTEEQVLSKAKVSLNLQDIEGRQLVAKFQMDRDDKYLELAFSDLWHVDEPDVATVPKDKEALSLIPTSLRKIGAKPKPEAKRSPPKEKPEAYDPGDF